MPAAHDIYVEQLCGLDYGTPLYYPEPDSRPNGGPIEIGDVGYVQKGLFTRLFNVTRSGDDPRQRYGVPKGFQPLTMGDIRTVDAALEPGPLKSEIVFSVDAGVGASGILQFLLPLDTSFHFKCTSDRGAVLFQETEMKRELVVQGLYPDEYMKKHCDAWLAFARENRIRLSFGELLLVTECSKTGAWASAVYANSAKEFGMSFSVGGSFSPYTPGVFTRGGVRHFGSILKRRSANRLTAGDPQPAKDHTVFFRAARLGTRDLYRKSLISILMHVIRNKISRKTLESQQLIVEPRNTDPHQEASSSSAPISQHEGSADKITLSDLPDFHPSIALLAMELENTDTECVVIHDDAWCHPSPEASRVIEDYRQFHFEDYKTLMALALDRQSSSSNYNSDSKPLLPAKKIPSGSHREKLNNIAKMNNWRVEWERQYTGSVDAVEWTSTVYIEEMACGTGRARDKGSADELAAKQAVEHQESLRKNIPRIGNR
ncbi:hypothetical protein H0H92_004285 [Tricholoma furcatifolium]|nr:hypothetical protein H0H92_004285 [Tricholoma furcatifolium]